MAWRLIEPASYCATAPTASQAVTEFQCTGVEEALYDSLVMRRFADLGREPVPDETTVCCFRHLLETTI
jgi:hypothetical protein